MRWKDEVKWILTDVGCCDWNKCWIFMGKNWRKYQFVKSRRNKYSAFGKSLCTYATVRRFGCQYRSCRWSVLLFHRIQLLNNGWSAIPVKCLVVWYSFYSLRFFQLRKFRRTCHPRRRMEKISWIDHMRNEEVLLRVNEQRNIQHEIRKRKANCMGHILRKNCLLK
jgi:hypothetical protein